MIFFRRSRRLLFLLSLLGVLFFTLSDTCLHASNAYTTPNANTSDGGSGDASQRSPEQDRWVAVALRAVVQVVISASMAAGTKNVPWGPVRAWPRLIVTVKGRLHSRFCVRFSVCDGATAQLLPLLYHVRDCARKAKEAVGQ
jgi:hypothetical protein